MRKVLFCALACILMMMPVAAFSQAVAISGIVTDQQGNPLPGANVYIEGTSAGAATDLEGRFNFQYQASGEFKIIIRFMGYKTMEQTLSPNANLSNLRFELDEDVFLGDAVVVTGIATKRSKSVAEVAVARVSANQLTKVQSFQDVSQMLTGKVAGVNVQAASGNVGSGIRFNVRSGGGLNGDEQPLIVIDGVRMDNNNYGIGMGGQQVSALADLDPEDIENIEILKGPAGAASYGTNGSNGVVLITTKRGKVRAGEGKSYTIEYKNVTGYNEQASKYTEDMILTYKDANANFKKGAVQQHSLSIFGGSNLVKYYVGLNRRSDDGIMPNNYMDRTTFRANVDINPSDKLIISASSSYTLNENQRPPNDDNIVGFMGNTLLLPIPYLTNNRAAIVGMDDKTKVNRFIGSFKVQYMPFKGFEASLGVGLDENNLREDWLRPQPFTYSWGFPNGWKRIIYRRNSQYTYDFNASYTYHPIRDLTITSNVGAQLFDRKFRDTWLGKHGYATDLITTIGAGENYSDGSEQYLHTRDVGIFTNHAISYNDQYFLTLMLRKDYASAIGVDAPSIYYPSVSMAVRLDKYDWFPKIFNLAKLRGAYGESGVLPQRLDAIPILWRAQVSAYGAGAWVSDVGNTTIKPERIKEYEIGFEAELFTNYSVEFTYYRQNAEDSIIDFANAPSTGLVASAVPFNVGKTKGWGLESLVQARPISTRNFELDLSMTNNYAKNEVVDLGGAQPIWDGWWNYNIIKEGLPRHAFYAQKVTGALFNDDGTYAGVQLAEDGADVYMGNPVPEYTGSFNISMRILKNFRVNILADWAQGHEVMNFTRRFGVWFGNIMGLGANDVRYRELEVALGLQEANPSPGEGLEHTWYPTQKVLTPGTQAYRDAANEFAKLDGWYPGNYIEDGSYFKLREISLSYSFKDLLPKITGTPIISDLILGVSGRNLWTKTNYSGPDPEINMAGARSLTRGFDFLTLQQPRTITAWLRLGL